MFERAKKSNANRSAARPRGQRLGWLLAGVIAGCVGYAVQPTAITSNGATLHGSFACAAESAANPCTGWFQYWQDGSSSVLETPHIAANINTSGNFMDFNQTVSGLSPSTLYHYEYCGYGDSNINPPGLCAGPLTAGAFSSVNNPGTKPDVGDLNATSNFRTAGPGSTGTFDLGRVLSSADTNDKPISRDAGYSIQYSSSPARALWIFGDTQQNHVGFIPFGSAATGSFTPGQAPTALNELPTPPAAPSSTLTTPSPFFRAPASLLRTNGSACSSSGSYAADWVMGGAKEPGSARILLVYGELCIESSPLAFTLERVAFAEYDPAANTFLRVDHPLVASPLNSNVPPQKALASPVFGGDGFVYLFAADCQGTFCSTKGAIYVARVGASASQWANGANFRWWTGSAWSSNSAAATSIIPGVAPLGGGVSVGDYSAVSSKKYVLVEQVGFGNAAFKVYTATSLTGPWTASVTSQPPDACNAGTFGCYAVIGHPELSSTSQLVYSWFSPDDRDGYGHVRLGAVVW